MEREAANFQRLIDEAPKEALKYIKEAEASPYWQYYWQRMTLEIKECEKQLRSCPLEKVLTARGYADGIEYAQQFTKLLKETLKDNIAINKEAEKIEAARKKETGDEKTNNS